MSIPLLVTIELDTTCQARFALAGFDLYFSPDDVCQHTLRAVLTNGSTGCSAALMARFPALEIICALGAGYENIDLVAASARGIVVTNSPGANAASVADHAFALLLAIARGIVQADSAVKRGEWEHARALRPSISGKNLGILGVGAIGSQIARRGADGFDMTVGWHGRHMRNDLPWRYFPSPVALAQWADFLVVATPGGVATRHLVDAAVLQALGPQGFLINIARGSVVDTQALIAALYDGRIAGAALDVIEDEPAVPAVLCHAPNVICTPHIAGRSPQAIHATVDLVLRNLAAHFAGQPVLTPVDRA